MIALSNLNAKEFLTKLGWLDDKGGINTLKLAEDLPFILHKDTIIQKMVGETGNQRRVASIKAAKNIDYSGNQRSGGSMEPQREAVERAMVQHFFEA